MIATRASAESEREWLWRYLHAAHAARVVVAAFALYVAVRTTHEIPIAGWFSVSLATAGVVWTAALAVAARPVDRILARRPQLIWLDPCVLLGLSLANKPWDAMVAVPYGCFLLFVVYAWPRDILILIGVMGAAQYLPRLALELADWRYAELTPPIGTGWFSAYVGPVFAGTICWALCVLVQGVRRAAAEHEQAARDLTRARVRRAEARARRGLADHVHDSLSQIVRAIPLMLGSDPPPSLAREAQTLRSQIVEEASRLRPSVQRIARSLRDAAGDESEIELLSPRSDRRYATEADSG